jgi:hypothetical protein
MLRYTIIINNKTEARLYSGFEDDRGRLKVGEEHNGKHWLEAQDATTVSSKIDVRKVARCFGILEKMKGFLS